MQKDHEMETSILQIKRKTENEMWRRCYARYANCEDQELGKNCHEEIKMEWNCWADQDRPRVAEPQKKKKEEEEEEEEEEKEEET
jgi:hypothetical protein